MHHFAVVRFSGSPHHDIAKGRLRRQSPRALDWNEHASVHVDGALRPVDSSQHSVHAMQRVLEPHRLPNNGILTELLRDVAPDRTEVLYRVERRHEPPFPELQAPQLGEVVGCADDRRLGRYRPCEDHRGRQAPSQPTSIAASHVLYPLPDLVVCASSGSVSPRRSYRYHNVPYALSESAYTPLPCSPT